MQRVGGHVTHQLTPSNSLLALLPANKQHVYTWISLIIVTQQTFFLHLFTFHINDLKKKTINK